MRIAMIGQKGCPARSGGVERHVEELSKRLVQNGHEVFVFCRSWYASQEVPAGLENVQRVFVPAVRSKHWEAISHTFLSILKAAALKADVFHIHGVGPALLSWLPKLLRPSAKVVVTFHCIDRYHQKWNRFARLMLHAGEWAACRFPDRTVTVSKTLAAYCRESYGTETRHIPNGVSPAGVSRQPSLLERFALEPEGYFLMVSRLIPHKGQHTLIRGWKIARSLSPSLFAGKKLAIVGGAAFTDGYAAELKALAAGDPSIVLTGEQTGEALHELYANAYAAVHPSTTEGLPLAVLEAMSYGKCTLTSDIPEHLEINGQHGLHFRTDDPEDLAEHLVMMAESPHLVAHVGKEGEQHVRRNYDWDEITLQTDMLYRQVMRPPEAQAVYATHEKALG